MVVLENQWGRAEVWPQGAHVVSYVPTGGRDVLWMSPHSSWDSGKPLRGGIPLCIPWFSFYSRSQPAHGFGRLVRWEWGPIETLADGASRVTFHLEGDGARFAWPGLFRFEHEVTLGSSLSLVVRAWNRGSQPQPRFDAVWHTYFRVDDLDRCRIEGLDGCRSVSRVGADDEQTQAGAIEFQGFFNRVYPSVPREQRLLDSGRRVRVASDASGAVVWNPGEKDREVPDLGGGAHRHFVCLERGSLASGARPLVPSEPQTYTLTITEEKGWTP